MSRGLNIKLISSQLNAYGYKIARKGQDDGGTLETVVDQEDLKTHFPKRGEHPDIKLKYAKKPCGTVGRGKFQLENIIGISGEDLKFCKKVVKTFLYLDSDIDMDEAKGNNPPGAVFRVVNKAVGVLGEFKIFEKDGYWPINAIALMVLKSTSQHAKGYGARSRAKKKERETARQAQGITTGSPAKTTSSRIGRPRKIKAPAIAEDPPSDNQPHTEADNCATQAAVVPEETFTSGNGERVVEGEESDLEDAMDTSFRASVPSGGPGASEEDEEEETLAQELSIMVLDPKEDNKLDEISSVPTGPFLPLGSSTPTQVRSRSHPCTPSLPPRRQLSKAPTTSDRCSLGNLGQSTTSTLATTDISDRRSSTTPSDSTPAPTPPSKSPSMAATAAGAPVSTRSTSQEPNNSSLPMPEGLQGITPELLAQLAVLPVPVLATFPPALQAAVAAFKSSTATSALNPTSTSTSAPDSAPVVPKRPRPTMVKAPAMVTPIIATANEAPAKAPTKLAPTNAPFDDDEYLSDPPSASESNPPIDIDPVLQRAPVAEPPSKPQSANTGPPKSSKKGPGGKLVAVDPEESPPTPSDTKGAAKEVPESTDLVGSGGKGKNKGKGARGAGTGAKRGGGRKNAKADVGEPGLVTEGSPKEAVGAGIDGPASKEPPTKGTRGATMKKKVATRKKA